MTLTTALTTLLLTTGPTWPTPMTEAKSVGGGHGAANQHGDGVLDEACTRQTPASLYARGPEPDEMEGVKVAAPDSSAPVGYVRIPAGTFTMGSLWSEECGFDDDGQHTVTLSRSFWLKATEVTQGEWRALMGSNPSELSSCGDTCPVEHVSWEDAIAYCNALSRKEGVEECYSGSFKGQSCRGYRLPTDAEWEYAARAGSTDAHYGELGLVGRFAGDSGSQTHPVGQTPPNAWGLYDMLGNVWEWCHDVYAGSLISATDPALAGGARYRVIRGMAWINSRQHTRSHGSPSVRGQGLGFRPARSIPSAPCEPPSTGLRQWAWAPMTGPGSPTRQ